MSDSDRGQQRPGQAPPDGAGGAYGNGASDQARQEELAAARGYRQPTPQSWPHSPRSGPNYERPPQHVTQQYQPPQQASGQPGAAYGQQPPRVQGQPDQPPQPFPTGYSGPSAQSVTSAQSGQSARSSTTPGQLYRPQQPPNMPPQGQPNGRGPAQTPNWDAPLEPKRKISLRERLGLTKPGEKSAGGKGTDQSATTGPSAQGASRASARSSATPKSASNPDTTRVNSKVRPQDRHTGATSTAVTGAAAGAAAGVAAGKAAGNGAGTTAPAARQAPIGAPAPARPGDPAAPGTPAAPGRSAGPVKTDEKGPNTVVMPAVPGVAAAGATNTKSETLAGGPLSKAGQARRIRKARLRLSRLDPWSVMKTSFLFSIAAGIMMVVAVYVVWTVLASSGLFTSMNEIVGSIISTPGDTTPFRVEDYVNTQKVMGVTALIACVDVVIFTSLATLGSFLYNLAATMLGGLEITLAED